MAVLYNNDHMTTLEKLLSSQTLWVALVLAAIILYWKSRSPSVKNIPVIGEKAVGWQFWKQGHHFNENATSILEKGLAQDRPFQVLTYNGPKIILPPRYLTEIHDEPRLTLDIPNDDDFFVKWPAFSPQGGFTHDHILIESIKRKLTPSLTRITQPVSEENEHAIKDLFPETADWKPIRIADQLLWLTAQTSSRIFLGTPTCRDPEALQLMVDWAIELVAAAQVMMSWPMILRPVVYLVHPQVRKLAGVTSAANRILLPEVKRQQALYDESRASGSYDERRLNTIQWMIETSQEMGKKFDLVGGVLSIGFGAIHTSSHTLTQIFYDIIDTPGLIEELREEIKSVAGDSNNWSPNTLYKLKLLDSVMKESQRLRPIRISLLRRVSLQSVRLKDGTTIPKGIEVNVPNMHMQSPDYYTDPHRFDPKRFLNLRSQPGNGSRYQFVTTGVESLGFGHGRHACPGRFFAANEMKLMLAHLLMKFDWKFKDGKRPQHHMIAEQTILDHDVEVLYRSRTSEVTFV